MKNALLCFLAGIFCIFLFMTPSRAQYALSFNGVNQYVTVADANQLDLTASYTMEAWIYPTGFAPLGGIISKYQTPGANGYTMRLNQNSPYTGFNANDVLSPNGFLNSDTWYHVAVTVTDTHYVTIYLNGVEITSGVAPYTVVANSDPLSFGVDYLDGARYWKGDIDEIRLWNTALSASRIAEWKDYEITSSHPEYANLIGYWNCNEGSGGTAVDSRNGSNAFLFGATWTTNSPPVSDPEIFVETYPGVIIGIDRGSSKWGDYDDDGDLDLVISGNYDGTSTGQVTKIYENTGSGFTEVFGGMLPNVLASSVDWGDYNNDGDLDILLTGTTDGFSSGCISKIFQNTGSGFTEVFPGSLSGMYDASTAWGDYDNDGDLDIIMAGLGASGRISRIYRNDDSAFSEVFPGSIVPFRHGSVTWGDYDIDGKLDILLVGLGDSGPVTKIYQNNGNGFLEAYSGSLPNVSYGTAEWGDYDNDGDLDIFLTGSTTGGSSGAISKVFQNTGSGFTEVFTGVIAGVMNGCGIWADFDNDGDLDIIESGISIAANISKIYQNNGAGFTELTTMNLPSTQGTFLSFGDYDNDGDLDFLMSGGYGSAGILSKLYKNTAGTPNTAPDSPSGLSASGSSEGITLRWNTSNDTQTPIHGLSYNVRIGSLVNALNVVSPMSDTATGYRKVVQIGNAGTDSIFSIKGLSPGEYYWSVQAIDNGYAGSTFSQEGHFISGPINLTLSATNGSVTKSQDTVYFNNPVILTATPVAGYHFTGWSGDLSGSENPDTVMMDANKIITANFAENEATINVADKWNLLSLPFDAPSVLKTNVFPTAVSNAFAYEGAYSAKDTLTSGVGYWLKFDSTAAIQVIGYNTLASDTVEVVAGWNIIGSLSNPLAASSITSEPAGIVQSPFFGFSNGYITADTLMPGKGYWVRVNAGGQLYLSSEDVISSTKNILTLPKQR